MKVAQSRSAERLLGIVQARDEANEVARSLLGGDHSLVGRLSLRTPALEPAELGFLRVVAWLYVQYFEAGAVGVRVVSGLLATYGMDESGHAREHIERTGRLRTYLQHNLDPLSTSDAATRAVCEDWFVTRCGSRVPGTDAHWSQCLCSQLEEAEMLFRALLEALRCLEADDAREDVVQQWMTRITRHHPPSAFDAIVSAAAADMGRPYLDPVRFRKRYYDRWVEALRGLSGEYEFEHEARKLVELALLSDVTAALPITGTEVIERLGVEPGPAVGDALSLARTLFDEAPCDGPTLLARLEGALTA